MTENKNEIQNQANAVEKEIEKEVEKVSDFNIGKWLNDNYKKLVEGVVVSVAIGVFAANMMNKTYKPIENLNYLQQESISSLILIMMLLSMAAGVIYYYSPMIARLALPTFTIIYSFFTITKNKEVLEVCIACIIVTLLAIAYVREDIFYVLSKIKINDKVAFAICCVIGFALIVFIGVIGCDRYKTFSNSTFDFGIFAQMFENLKNTLKPVTSVERPELGNFSHFGVHFSPIYYLMLPIYFIFSSPLTVQIMQALVLGLAVIPLYFLCKHYGISNKMTIAMCAIYCLFPAVASGTYYDFHENCVLPLTIFCLLLALEKKNTVGIILSALAVCMVKEDAAIVVLSIGLFLLLSAKDAKRGVVLTGASLVYFYIAMKVIQSYGDQNFDSRFGNILYDYSKGLTQVAVTIPANISYMLSQMANTEKLTYTILMILPLSIALIQKKKYSRYLLLMTFILINMLPSYPYMHDIGFQYNYSTVTLMMYIAIMTVSEWDVEKVKIWGISSVLITAFLFICMTFPKWETYTKRYRENENNYIQMENAISSLIPKDASVATSGFMMPHLYFNNNVVVVKEGMEINQDYAVIDLRGGYSNDNNNFAYYLTNDYEVISEVKNMLIIYKKK